MASKLIHLEDGTLIEVEAGPRDVQQISFSSAACVEKTTEVVKPLLVHACQPVIDAWNELGQDIDIEQAEVELGLSFEGQGNVYITKATAGANLRVTLTMKPKHAIEEAER